MASAAAAVAVAAAAATATTDAQSACKTKGCEFYKRGPGVEVETWQCEHLGGRSPWRMLAASMDLTAITTGDHHLILIQKIPIPICIHIPISSPIPIPIPMPIPIHIPTGVCKQHTPFTRAFGLHNSSINFSQAPDLVFIKLS